MAKNNPIEIPISNEQVFSFQKKYTSVLQQTKTFLTHLKIMWDIYDRSEICVGVSSHVYPRTYTTCENCFQSDSLKQVNAWYLDNQECAEKFSSDLAHFLSKKNVPYLGAL